MRALITGGYGFAGRHLANHLAKCGDDVAVTFAPQFKELETGKDDPRSAITLPRTAQAFALDITDAKAVTDVITLTQPDVVYHLAGMTFVPEAEKNFRAAYEVNVMGTINLLDAVAKHSPKSKFLYVSSCEVYGEPWPGTLPLNEGAPFRPVSAYGVTKISADVASFQYSYKHNVDLVRARPFPHVGPGQSDSFALASFAKQIALIKLGKEKPEIKVGNLEAKRDYSDVADIVRGYREAILNGKRGEAYNLCSGVSRSMKEILDLLIKVAEVEVEVVVDPERVRPVDITDLYGSYQKAQKDFGWKPRIDLDATLHSLFAFWVEFLSKR